MPSRDALLALLNAQKISFDLAPTGMGVEVHQTLYIKSQETIELPDGLIVHGSLDLTCTRMPCLPKGLIVDQNLYLGDTCCALTSCVSIGGLITLEGSKLTTLPDHLRVGGALNLCNSRIERLPAGLDIGGTLSIRNTSIQRLPEDMRVQGTIYPNGNLLDIQAFMATQNDAVVFTLPRTHHERMAINHQLLPFPDLARVVLSMEPDFKFRIERDGTGQITCSMRRIPWHG